MKCINNSSSSLNVMLRRSFIKWTPEVHHGLGLVVGLVGEAVGLAVAAEELAPGVRLELADSLSALVVSLNCES
jgi:hypothetical protein